MLSTFSNIKLESIFYECRLIGQSIQDNLEIIVFLMKSRQKSNFYDSSSTIFNNTLQGLIKKTNELLKIRYEMDLVPHSWEYIDTFPIVENIFWQN